MKQQVRNLLAHVEDRRNMYDAADRRARQARNYQAANEFGRIVRILDEVIEALQEMLKADSELPPPPVPWYSKIEHRSFQRWLDEVEVVPPGWRVVNRVHIMDNSVIVEIERTIYA